MTTYIMIFLWHSCKQDLLYYSLITSAIWYVRSLLIDVCLHCMRQFKSKLQMRRKHKAANTSDAWKIYAYYTDAFFKQRRQNIILSSTILKSESVVTFHRSLLHLHLRLQSASFLLLSPIYNKPIILNVFFSCMYVNV